MKWICHHCGYKNPPELPNCAQCGNAKGENARTAAPGGIFQKILKLGTFGWVLIFLAGLATVILTPILFIIAISHLEGFASILLLLGGFWGAKSAVNSGFGPPAKAVFIVFFSVMGLAIDQPGNYLYNYPIRFLCPSGTSLTRSVDVTHPLPGRTDMTQSFSCVNAQNAEAERISLTQVLGIRFLEYVLIAWILLSVQKLRLERKKVKSG
ncbi:zinc finger Ran-binding domain-containing protein [Leptospira ellisii]|uniref:Zinc finger Ran-binding domain-containing protein n=3 Tax=Leptospira ellisii TaxID=2023197 RepID=A0AAE4QQ21_9LEPT|nr:Ran-binding zinc finger domain-containing protein [Leptospira ellisii]MDV6236595.1 zinc finger Ran-binding domain-containing protein [Leptospira ellisii]